MKTILYPRPAYTQVIIDWDNKDWQTVSADRNAALEALKGTVERLVLPARYDRMRREILSGGGGGPVGGRPGLEPRRELLGVMLGNLRYHGYIHRSRRGGPWGLSPLTPRQTHLVRLMAEDNTLKRSASLLGVTHSTTRKICQTAMEWAGVHTSAGLVGVALYRGWIPGRTESENLYSNLREALGPGYITR